MNKALHLPPTIHVLQRGWLSSNNIVFLGREQTAVVDTGYASHVPQTLALLAHTLQGRPLDRIINTHLHSDHCGGNAALQQAYRCRTTVPEAEAELVSNWNDAQMVHGITGQQCPRFSFDDTMAAGDVLTLGDLDWQVLASPGHDPHSLILYCPGERILISADALWENGFGVVFPELTGESGFAEVRATLELIATLDVKLVIPGHGAPFTDVPGALQRAFSRLDYLAADPVRNAQHAVKVLLKFLLLERQQIALSEVEQIMSRISLIAEINRRYLQQSEAQLTQWTVKQLVRAQAAKIEDQVLLNHDEVSGH